MVCWQQRSHQYTTLASAGARSEGVAVTISGPLLGRADCEPRDWRLHALESGFGVHDCRWWPKSTWLILARLSVSLKNCCTTWSRSALAFRCAFWRRVCGPWSCFVLLSTLYAATS